MGSVRNEQQSTIYWSNWPKDRTWEDLRSNACFELRRGAWCVGFLVTPAMQELLYPGSWVCLQPRPFCISSGSPGLKHQLLTNSKLAGLSVFVCIPTDISPRDTFPQRVESWQNSWNIITATIMATRDPGTAGTAGRVMPTGRENE